MENGQLTTPLAPVEETPAPVLRLRTPADDVSDLRAARPANQHPNPIAIQAIWLRRQGKDLHVLVERANEWYDIGVIDVDGEVSHIIETAGIARAPRDTWLD